MILSFGDKNTEELFIHGGSRQWHPHLVESHSRNSLSWIQHHLWGI